MAFRRFENIAVNVAAVDPGIVVSQNVISWPDNGWYQVQNADTDESICNGGRSCVVGPGQYRVINHTTGIRYEGFIVDGGQPLPNVSDLRFERYSTTAIELFWSHPETGEPANGYSILQDGVPIANISGRSLFIENLPDTNSYEFVVAQSGLTIGESITVSAAEKTLNMGNAKAILANVVSVINEDAIEAFYETANEDQLFQGKYFFISNTTDEIALTMLNGLRVDH